MSTVIVGAGIIGEPMAHIILLSHYRRRTLSPLDPLESSSSPLQIMLLASLHTNCSPILCPLQALCASISAELAAEDDDGDRTGVTVKPQAQATKNQRGMRPKTD